MAGHSSTLGDRQKAVAFYQQAAPLWHQAGQIEREALILNNLGTMQIGLGDGLAAIKSLEQALPLRRKVGDLAGEAKTLTNLGYTHFTLGDTAKAMEYLKSALPLYRKAGDASGEAAALTNIGVVQVKTGDKKAALESFERARASCLQAGDDGSLMAVLVHLGRSLASNGRATEGVGRLREAAALYLRRSAPKDAISVLQLALDVAIQGRLPSDGREVLDDLRKAGVPDRDLAAAEARLVAHTSADRGAVQQAWQGLMDSAKGLEGEARARRERMAQAGLDRVAHAAAWLGCGGVLVNQVVEGGPAVALGLRPGDVLLRYGGECVNATADLVDRTGASEKKGVVPDEPRRGDQVIRLEAAGGKLGIAIEAF